MNGLLPEMENSLYPTSIVSQRKVVVFSYGFLVRLFTQTSRHPVVPAEQTLQYECGRRLPAMHRSEEGIQKQEDGGSL